jgi:uncharacterized RDD family membrane protein YckC
LKIKDVDASLFRRTIAYLIDILVINIVIIIPLGPLLTRTTFSNSSLLGIYQQEMADGPVFFAILLFIPLMTILYWAILEYYLQQSIGKMIMRIYVRHLTKKIMFWQALLRNVTKISTIFLVLDCAYMLIYKTNQRYFEKLSHTQVVEKI